VKGNFYTLAYACILSAVCAVLLTAAAEFTAPYKAANAEAERKRNILDVLGVLYPAGISPAQLVKLFEENVREEQLNGLTLYRYNPANESGGAAIVAVEFEGPGLWGPIKGFLALSSDMRTIRAVTFYEQEETPGLGAEITSDWFCKQFEGKKIVGRDGKAGIFIRRGRANAINEVEAITGATMTCEKVEAMLNTIINRIVEESKKDGQ